jgi:phospholipid-translocating ATPase
VDPVQILVQNPPTVLDAYKLTYPRIYMFDGIYQSIICFFMGYLLFAPATFVTESGRGVADTGRMGVYVACATIAVVNIYVLLNTYRWDWLILLIVAISTLLIWFWTGVYSSFPASFQFYKSASEVYGTLTFWTLTLLTIIVCLLPRFAAKFIQKNFFPLDIDIIREQMRQGVFDYLDEPGSAGGQSMDSSTTSSELAKPVKANGKGPASIPESERPIYPPSEATTKTRNPRSQNSSDVTDTTRPSLDLVPPTRPRPSSGQVRSSFERSRQSMDRLRPSFEGSRDFTSAALLTRVESSASHSNPTTPYPITPSSSRMRDITSELQ